MSQDYDLIVIGTGIAGLSAARQALQDGLRVATLEAVFCGGLVTNINELDGEIEGSGSDLAAELMLGVAKAGAKNITAEATGITSEGETLVVASDAGAHRARALVVATGARLKRLGVPGEAELEDLGVSHCADCDGPFYRDKDVVVVGGGDSALQEALVLAEFARRVHLVHRGAAFGARAHLVERVAAQAGISTHWRKQVEAVLGEQEVEGVRLRDLDGGPGADLPCSGFFAYVGLAPASGFLPAAIARDAEGRLLTDAALQTSMPGVYAAGAVRAGYGGLLTHAMADGVAAARSACARIRA